MLGLLLIYFIGKYFYDLAAKFGKSKWLFAIIGIVTYYGGTILFGVVLGVYAALTNSSTILGLGDLALTLISIPVGIIIAWGLYTLLKNQWQKKTEPVETEILDAKDALDF